MTPARLIVLRAGAALLSRKSGKLAVGFATIAAGTYTCAKLINQSHVIKCQPTTSSRAGFSESTNKNTWVQSAIWRLRLVIRSMQFTLTYLPIIVIYPLMACSQYTYMLWWKMALKLIEMSGPTIIKFAQWAATRRDLFSAEFCNRLSRLQRRTSTRSWRQTEKVLQDTYGHDWRNFFVRFDIEPIGSGCIAQVFKAELDPIYFEKMVGSAHTRSVLRRYHSQAYVPVAIKIAHPGIRWEMARDLAVMKSFAWLLETLVPSMRFLEPIKCLEDFGERMETQTDLTHEARALTRMANNFKRAQRITFPTPIHFTRNILVETYEEGVPIGNFVQTGNQHEQSIELNRVLAYTGVRAVCQMIFVDNFVHGDLHPGNILVQNHERPIRVRPDDMMECTLERLRRAMMRFKLWSDRYMHTSMSCDEDIEELSTPFCKAVPRRVEPTIVILDAGITVELNERDRKNFRDVFKALVLADGAQIAEMMMNQAPQHWCKDSAAFKSDMASLIDGALAHSPEEESYPLHIYPKLVPSAVIAAKVEMAAKTMNRMIKLKHLHIAKLMSDLLTIVSTHKVVLEANFTSVVLALIVLEGMGRSLDPDLDIIAAARPYLLYTL